MKNLKYDLIVTGAGAGGIGAAISAARMGVKTLLVDREKTVGGNVVAAGVSCWEASASGTGLSREIYYRMADISGAVDIYPSVPAPIKYEQTLTCSLDINDRINDPKYKYNDFIKGRYGVIFEPPVFDATVKKMLNSEVSCDLALNAEFKEAEFESGKMCAVYILENGKKLRVEADFFIDSTGDATLCKYVGCKMLKGAESSDIFNEPGAPSESDPNEINGVSLIFRVSKEREKWLDFPENIHIENKDILKHSVWMRRFPNGEWSVNMLPSMNGKEFFSLPRDKARIECRRRAFARWELVKKERPELDKFNICWIAPRIGVRESHRTLCEYMLSQNDIENGISAQSHKDIVAISDHPLDVHGTRQAGSGLLKSPYGIPFRCLIPKDWNNLLVACRGAGFSHIAASSCRLTRTMMQLGQAAGTSVALAKKKKCWPRNLSSSEIQMKLAEQGIVLDYRKLNNLAPL